MAVQQHTPRAIVLIGLGFSSPSQRQGTRIGGGKWCPFVIIPLGHPPSRQVLLGHARSPLNSQLRYSLGLPESPYASPPVRALAGATVHRSYNFSRYIGFPLAYKPR
jgi:hypothetical protein